MGYGSVKKMLAAECVRAGGGARVVEATLELENADDGGGPPLSAEMIVDLVRRTLPRGPGCKLAVIDAVTSNTALLLPVQQIAAVCRERGVPVLLDAAHLLGSVHPAEVRALGCDYVVGNLHKWFCNPRGAGFLWAARHAQAGLRPLVTSHGAADGFLSSFVWDGNRDYSPVLAVPATLRFWRWLGGPSAVVGYQRTLLAEAAQLLVKRWGTGTLAPLETLCAGMALVRLPAGQLPDAADAPEGATSAHAKAVQDCLHALRIEVPVKNVRGRLYVRISAHVYNRISDYEALAEAVAGAAARRLLPTLPRAGAVCVRGGACG